MNGVTHAEDENDAIVTSKEMCFYCFDVLQYELKKAGENSATNKKRKSPPLEPPNPQDYSIPEFECPLFVGWKKRGKHDPPSPGPHKLRGCKGTHGSLPLNEGLKQYALLSAFDDSRFTPIREEEVPRLTCSVSLLYGFEKVVDCYDWEVGTHGVRIDFRDSKNHQRSATFLPNVAPQFGYDQQQTIERLVEKSGCEERVDKRLLAKIKTTRFQAAHIDTPYEDYLQYIKLKGKPNGITENGVD